MQRLLLIITSLCAFPGATCAQTFYIYCLGLCACALNNYHALFKSGRQVILLHSTKPNRPCSPGNSSNNHQRLGHPFTLSVTQTHFNKRPRWCSCEFHEQMHAFRCKLNSCVHYSDLCLWTTASTPWCNELTCLFWPSYRTASRPPGAQAYGNAKHTNLFHFL